VTVCPPAQSVFAVVETRAVSRSQPIARAIAPFCFSTNTNQKVGVRVSVVGGIRIDGL
jgi:hypothetical protein